jgi:hypothetical protein
MSHEATVFVYMILVVTGIIISGQLINKIRKVDGNPMAIAAGLTWFVVVVFVTFFFSH